MNDNKKKMYDALSADYDMGDFETFAADVEDSVKRRKLYDTISGEYELGDFDSFSKQLLGTTTTPPAQAAQPKAEANPQEQNVPAAQTAQAAQTTQVATQSAQAQAAQATQAAAAETPWTAEMMALARQHHLKETGEDPIAYMPRGYRTGRTGSDDELLAAWYNETEDTRKQLWDKQAELDVADYKADRDAVYAEQGKWDTQKAKQWREKMMATYRIDPMQEIPETYRAATEQKWGKKGSDEAVLAAWLNEKENARQGQWNEQMQKQKQKYMEIMNPLSGFEGRERKAILEERKRQIESQLNQPGAVRNAAARTNMAKTLESIDQELQVLNEQQKQWQEQYGSWTPSSARRFREQTMEQTWYDPYGEVPESYKEAATKQWGKKGSEDAYFAAWMNMTSQERQAYLHAEHIKQLTEGENRERMQTIYERAKSRGNEAGKQMNETFFKGAWSPGQAQGAGNAFAAWQAQQPTTHTLKAIEKANEIIEAYRNHQADENFFIGAFKGMKDGLSDIDNWTGVYMAGEMQNLYAIADKMEKGEVLTQDEEDFLDAQAYRLAIEASLAEDLGWGYKSGNTTGASIPFMLQMLASPVSVGAEGSINAINKGFAAVGKRAIKKFGKTILRRTLAMPKGLEMAGKALNIAGKVAKPLSRIVGKVADTRAGQLIGKGLKATALAAEAGVAQAFLFNSDKMVADAMERHLGNEMLTERANEQYGTNLIAKEGEEWLTAITKAVASQSAEQGSEFLGTTLFEPMGKMIARSGAGEIGDLLSGISATTLMRAAKNSRAGAALRLMSQVQVKGSKVLDEIMGKAQWNGLFGEYLEELANGAVSVAIGDIEAEKFASAKHQAETILGLAWTSGALGVLRGGQRVKMYAKAHRLLADTDRTAQLLFTHEDGTINQEMMQKWEQFKASLEGKDLEGMRAELSRVMDDIQALAPTQGGMNIRRMRLLMDYMKGYAYLMGISSADNADEQELTAEQEQAETALAEGMTADTPEAQADIVQALAESEKRLGEVLGTEDVDLWLDAMGETAEAQLEALHNDTALPDETKQAAEQYLNDRLRYEGVRTMAEEEVESRVNSAMAEFDQNTNKDTGKLTEVRMKDESTAYVVAGSLEAGGNIYIRYADGRLVHAAASDVVEVLSDQQAQPVRDMMAEGVRQQAVAEIAARMQAEQQRRQAEATRHSIPADETVPAEEVVAAEGVVAATESAAPVEVAVAEEAAPREDADYEAMTPEEAVDDLWARTQEDEEVMDGSIQDTIEQMQQRLAEAEAAPIAAGTNMTERIANRQAHNAAVAQAKASLEHWQKIAAMAEQRKAERAAQTQEAEELNQQLERQRQQEEQQRLQEEQQRLQEEQARIEREQKAAEQKAHAEEVQANMERYIAEAEAHNSQHDVREISRQTGVEAKRIKRILDWAAEHGVKIDFENYTTTGKHGQGQMTNANIVSDKRRIVLNKGVLSDGTAIEFIAGHELTHQAKADGNMEAWENLRKATIEAMGQERYDREFERTKRLYRQAYRDMSEQELNAAIEEEVVADWSGMIFLDPEAIDKMRNVPKNFAQKVYTWLKNFFYGEEPQQVKDAISAWQMLAEGKELTGEAADREKHSIVGTTGARALDKAEGTTVRMDNMDVAEEMEAAGKDAETIWLATGWERGADGKWKYEVLEDFAYEEPRAKAERLQEEYQQVQNEKENIYRYLNRFPARGLTEQQKAIKKEQNARLKKLIRQGEQLQDEIIESRSDTTLGELIGTDNNIIKAYPELASMPVSFVENSRFMDAGLKGAFDGEGIWINPTLENTAPTLLHEVQHAIQRIEGFARGGNTGSVKTKADALREDVRPLHEMMLDTPEWAERQRLQNRWFDETDAAEIAKIEQRVNEINESGVLDAIQSKRKQLQEKYGSDATVGKILGSPYAEDAEIWQQLPESFNDKYQAYRNLAGEAEARNVSARLNMSEEERRQTRPGKTEDVAREEQTVIYAEVSDKAGEQLEETASATRYSIVVDPQLIAELEASPKRKGYRNVVQREDGLFEAPMGNSLRGNGITVENTPFAMGQWEQSEEHPELVYGDNKITLVKPDGKTVADVNYNPYIHNRLNTLNAQFKQAWERPDLVYIETEVPETDLESGYMAEHAHLSTGVHQWSNGALMLSRYDKPVRIVPWDEVAIPWIEKYKKSGVHFDIVPPALRPILAAAGVEIKAPHNGMGENCTKAYEEWKAEQEANKKGSAESRTSKATQGERSDADSHNSSSKGLPLESSERLSVSALASPKDFAKIRKNTEILKRATKKIINEGGLKRKMNTPSQAVSALGDGLHLEKSGASQSYYGDYFEGDYLVDEKVVHLRISTHPASGDRMGNAKADHKVSIVVRKNGEHHTKGEHNGYEEIVYDPAEISPDEAANAIVYGVKSLIETGKYVDTTGKAKKQTYPYVDEAGVTRYSITSVNSLTEVTNEEVMHSISPIEGYTYSEVIDMVQNDVENILSEEGADNVEAVEFWAHGSRMRGNAKEDSDLDVVMFYKGNEKEDSLFNLINEHELAIDGIKVDVNPIRISNEQDIARYKEKSARYDQEMRFSLAGLHNISEEKLKKAIKQGGLANPSVAVIDLDTRDHNTYGDITLVLPSYMIDKKQGRNAGTYMGDAWTPTYPRVSMRLDNKGWRKIDEFIASISDDAHMRSNMHYAVEDFMQGGTTPYMQYAFLRTKGIEIPFVYKNNDRYISNEEFKELIGMDALTAFNGSIDAYNKFKELPKEAQDELYIWIINRGDKAKIKAMKESIQKDQRYAKLLDYEVPFSKFNLFANDTFRREQDNGKIDYAKTFSEANNHVATNGLGAEYNAWISNLLEEAGAEEYIFAGFTPSGNAKYLPHTLENVSKVMKKEGKSNAYNNTGYSPTRAGIIKALSTLGQIRKNSDTLRTDINTVDETKEELTDRLYELRSKLADMRKLSDNPFINGDYAESRLQEALSRKNPVRYLNEEYGYNIEEDGDFAKKLESFIDDVRKAPVRYFETKFERPVMLDEFHAAVIPNDTDTEVVKALEKAGLNVETYERGNDAERKEALLRASDEHVRFSLSAEEQSIVDAAKANGTYMKAPNGKPTNLNENQWAQVRTKAYAQNGKSCLERILMRALWTSSWADAQSSSS